MDHTIQDERRNLIQRTFPDGIARLWCPPLTHYRHDASLDTDRIKAHIRALAPFVGGLLDAAVDALALMRRYCGRPRWRQTI